MNRLWVLVYTIGDLEIFLTPDNNHTRVIADALKFHSEESANEHRDSLKSLFKFSPVEKEIYFKE